MKWCCNHVHVGMEMKSRERNTTCSSQELYVIGSSVETCWLPSLWLRRSRYLLEEKQQKFEKMIQALPCMLPNAHTCVQYTSVLFYCSLLCAMYFPHWTPSAIPWEEHYYPHLQMRKGFRIYIDTLHQIALCKHQRWELNMKLCPCD